MRWNKIWANAKYRKTTHIENAELYSFLALDCISAHVPGHGPQLCKKYGVRTTLFGSGGLMVENALLLPLALFEAAADSLHAIDLLGVWVGDFPVW